MNIKVLRACFEYDAIDSDDEDDVEESEFDSPSIVTDQEYEEFDKKDVLGLPLAPCNVKPSEHASKAIEAFQVPEASAEKPWPTVHEDLVSESSLDIESPILTDLSNLFLTHDESALVEVDPLQAESSGGSSEIKPPTSLLRIKDVLEQPEELPPALIIDSPKLEFGDEFHLGSSQFLEIDPEGMGALRSYSTSNVELHEEYNHCAPPASEDNIVTYPHECRSMATLCPIGKNGNSKYTMHVDSSSESNSIALQSIEDSAHPIDASAGEIKFPHDFFISHLDSRDPPKETVGLLDEDPELEAEKPRPVGLNEKMTESALVEVDFNRVKLGDFPSSGSSSSLLRLRKELGQSEGSSPAPSIDQPKFQHLDFGAKFKMEDFRPSCSDEADSRENWESLSSISEEAMSLDEAPASAPPESTGVTKKETAQLDHSADLEIARIKADTGYLSMEDVPLLDFALDMALESHMAHCDAALRRLQLPDHYSDYGCQNEFYDTRLVPKNRRCDRGFRGRSSGPSFCSYPLLGRSQALDHTFILPMTAEHEFGQGVHGLKEDLWSITGIKMRQPRKGPDKSLETSIRDNRVPSHSVGRSSSPISIVFVRSDYERGKYVNNYSRDHSKSDVEDSFNSGILALIKPMIQWLNVRPAKSVGHVPFVTQLMDCAMTLLRRRLEEWSAGIH